MRREGSLRGSKKCSHQMAKENDESHFARQGNGGRWSGVCHTALCVPRQNRVFGPTPSPNHSAQSPFPKCQNKNILPEIENAQRRAGGEDLLVRARGELLGNVFELAPLELSRASGRAVALAKSAEALQGSGDVREAVLCAIHRRRGTREGGRVMRGVVSNGERRSTVKVACGAGATSICAHWERQSVSSARRARRLSPGLQREPPVSR